MSNLKYWARIDIELEAKTQEEARQKITEYIPSNSGKIDLVDIEAVRPLDA